MKNCAHKKIIATTDRLIQLIEVLFHFTTIKKPRGTAKQGHKVIKEQSGLYNRIIKTKPKQNTICLLTEITRASKNVSIIHQITSKNMTEHDLDAEQT